MKKFIYVCALLAASVTAYAQESASYDYAMEFSGIPRNPVTVGTGMAGSASASTMAWSAFGNPAAMSFYDGKFDAQALFQSWQPSLGKSTNLGLGAAYRIKEKFGVSLGFLRTQGEAYDITNEFGAGNGTFTPSEMLFGLGLSLKVADFVSVGVNLKGMSQSLASGSSASSFGADIFAMAAFSDFSASLGVTDLGSAVKSSSGESFNLPASLKLGGAYHKTFAEVNSVEALLDLDYYFLAGGFSAALGAQYGWKDMAFVRAGYHYGSADALVPSFASLGIGAKVYGVRLDLAYLLGSETLKNSLTVGLGYTF